MFSQLIPYMKHYKPIVECCFNQLWHMHRTGERSSAVVLTFSILCQLLRDMLSGQGPFTET